MSKYTAWQQKLENRMMQLALDVIRLSKQVEGSAENKIITAQLIRSATSIGANYTEANNAASKQDFRNKIYISNKEASETRYWLKLLSKVSPDLNITRLTHSRSPQAASNSSGLVFSSFNDALASFLSDNK